MIFYERGKFLYKILICMSKVWVSRGNVPEKKLITIFIPSEVLMKKFDLLPSLQMI